MKKRASELGSTIQPLDRTFFRRDPRRVARDLLGKILLREGEFHLMARIVEVEAYLGENDPAAHAAAGNTARNSVLFGPPGYAYVYFIYGNHYCLNVSCLPVGVAGGVLFRALEPVAGIAEMAAARDIEIPDLDEARPALLKKISSGPGRMSEAFGVTRERDNGKDFTSTRSDLRIVEDDYRVRGVTVTPRIGIVKAAERPLRYFITGSPFVSGRKSQDR